MWMDLNQYNTKLLEQASEMKSSLGYLEVYKKLHTYITHVENKKSEKVFLFVVLVFVSLFFSPKCNNCPFKIFTTVL